MIWRLKFGTINDVSSETITRHGPPKRNLIQKHMAAAKLRNPEIPWPSLRGHDNSQEALDMCIDWQLLVGGWMNQLISKEMHKSNWIISPQVGIKLNKCLKPTPIGIEWHLSTHSSCTFWTPGHFLMRKVMQFKAKKQNILHQSSFPFKQKTHVACCAPLKMSVLLALLHGFANLVLVLTKNPELEIDTSTSYWCLSILNTYHAFN